MFHEEHGPQVAFLDRVYRYLSTRSVVGEDKETPAEAAWLDQQGCREDRAVDLMIRRALGLIQMLGLGGLTNNDLNAIVALLEPRMALARLVRDGEMREEWDRDARAYGYAVVDSDVGGSGGLH